MYFKVYWNKCVHFFNNTVSNGIFNSLYTNYNTKLRVLRKISNKDSVSEEYYQFLELLYDTCAVSEQTLIEVFVFTISFTYSGIVNGF